MLSSIIYLSLPHTPLCLYHSVSITLSLSLCLYSLSPIPCVYHHYHVSIMSLSCLYHVSIMSLPYLYHISIMSLSCLYHVTITNTMSLSPIPCVTCLLTIQDSVCMRHCKMSLLHTPLCAVTISRLLKIIGLFCRISSVL